MEPRAFAGQVKRKIKELLLKSRLTSVPVDSLLVGGEQSISARHYALLTRDLLRPSTRFIHGPHVTFLQEYQSVGATILDRHLFEKTLYFRNAQTCMDLTGHYFWARRDDQLLDIAREFIDRFENRVDKSTRSPKPGQSRIGMPIQVKPVSLSRLYSVLDGNHRLAVQYVRGIATATVAIVNGPEYTPLQQMLRDVLWTGGSLELYQPVELPECRDRWRVVRKCTDRLGMFKAFLKEVGLTGPGMTYLDIGSYYGWFVSQMAQLGFDAYGIERDPIAAEIGQWVYGNRPEQIVLGDCARILKDHPRVYDVVSIQSVLHHFAMRKGGLTPNELIRLVDKITGSVMFFETGQSHEAWFRSSLSDWTPDFIEHWLRKNTSFSRVVRLGVDEDAIGQYQHNYGRTMFACTR